MRPTTHVSNNSILKSKEKKEKLEIDKNTKTLTTQTGSRAYHRYFEIFNFFLQKLKANELTNR